MEHKRKTEPEFIDRLLGFPILLRNVTMLWIQGEWVADINYNQLQEATALALALKPARLTGAEVKFLRLYWEMTFQKFADLFAVRPQTVMKWEKTGQQPTKMAWSTEKDLRLTILERQGADKAQFVEAFQSLRKERPLKKKSIGYPIEFKKARSARNIISAYLKQQAAER